MGVCILLEDDWRLTSDAQNWVLEKKNKNTWVAKGEGGYFTNLGDLLNYYITTKCRTSNATSFTELAEVLQSSTKRIMTAIAPIDKAGITTLGGYDSKK